MTLLQHIRNERARQRKKNSLKRDTFNQISGLVRQYDLKDNFLSVLDNLEEYLSRQKLKFARVKVKMPIESPLFSLVTKEEYSLAMSIIRRVDNSYLRFAHSPEEILLSGPLYRLNPSFSSELLMRYHFETLFLHERAKANQKS